MLSHTSAQKKAQIFRLAFSSAACGWQQVQQQLYLILSCLKQLLYQEHFRDFQSQFQGRWVKGLKTDPFVHNLKTLGKRELVYHSFRLTHRPDSRSTANGKSTISILRILDNNSSCIFSCTISMSSS